ncbi:pentapeptide repeat-containing protein [Spirulina major]|uniref:pentapeptide repeat-containing protein n=1 Tax=Spirulina major TaxID=270636 RepID=UPI000933D1D9|nr:pentapeptide repeat-containing protein [Spirulina major]
MKARDVLQRYAAGEREFQGANLRGRSFRGKCLAGADFSGADIRGTDFTQADLTGVKFCRATAGLQQRQWVLSILIAWVMAAFSGFLYWIPEGLIGWLFSAESTEAIAGWIAIVILLAYFATLIHSGVLAGISTLAVIVAVTVVMAVASTSLLLIISEDIVSLVATAIAGAGARSAAVAVVVLGSITIAITIAMTEQLVIVGAVAIAFIVAMIGVIALAAVEAIPLAVIVEIAAALFLTGLNIYLAWRAMRGDPRDLWIRATAVAVAAWGGTCFRGADLTDADFSHAQLKCCDFREYKGEPTTLIRTVFKASTKIDLARPGKTLLAHPNIRNILINPGNGYNQNFYKMDLRGASLVGGNFEKANFKQADLSEADVRGANLKEANFTDTLVVGTNFTHAYLTGACLEAWNLDPTTIFKDVDCQYIYLREYPNTLGSRERRPHDPDKVFAPGDFERLYTQLMHTVEILLKGGMDNEAFAVAFQKIVAENSEITWDSVQSIEKKGEDVLLTLEVPPDTDKAQVERTFDAAYVARLEAQAEAQTLRAQDMKDLALALANQQNTINVKAESKAMSDNPNISVGGDFKGNLAGGDLDASSSVQNFDNLNSTISTALNQLPEPTESDKPNLKTILSELHTAINDSELEDDDKAEALAQLDILVQAGQTPSANGIKKQVKRATTMLTGLIASLPAAAKLVDTAKTLLPAIATYFGL